MKRGKPAVADCRDLFEGFPDGAVLERFQKIQLASNDAPTPSFGRNSWSVSSYPALLIN